MFILVQVNDSYNHAKEVVKYYHQEYQATTLEPAQQQSGSGQPVEYDSLLKNITCCSLSLLLVVKT